MRIIGRTADNIFVVCDIAKGYFERGIPLCFIFDKLNSAGCLPSWHHLYDEPAANGLTHKRIIHLLHENVIDTYGAKFRDHIIKKLNDIRS